MEYIKASLDKSCHEMFNRSCLDLQQLLSFPEISTSTYCFLILAICLPPIFALIIYEREQARLLAEQPKGCRKLGMKIKTNLANEFDPKFSEGRPPSTEETSAEWWRIKSIWIYPVKSCRGVELNRGTIGPNGMHFDRQFAFAQLRSPFPVALQTSEKEKSAHKWEVITQKDYPRLADVRTEMWVPDQSVDTYTPHAEDVESEGVIIISFPWEKIGWRGTVAKWGAAVLGNVLEMPFRVPFNPTPVQIDREGYTYEKLTVWNETITALNMEAQIPEELRYFLGISNKLGLFRIDASGPKVPSTAMTTTTTTITLNSNSLPSSSISSFQDAHPVHLINLASVRDIETNMVKTPTTPRLSASRFRANIIITGPEAYHEDSWRRIKIGFYEYDVMNRTPRVKSSDKSDDSQRIRNDKSKRIIQSYRTEDEGPGIDVTSLGMQMIPLSHETALRVGDEIILQEVDARHTDD